MQEGPGRQDRAHTVAWAARLWGPAAPRHAFREAAGCVIIARLSAAPRPGLQLPPPPNRPVLSRGLLPSRAAITAH